MRRVMELVKNKTAESCRNIWASRGSGHIAEYCSGGKWQGQSLEVQECGLELR